MGIQTFVKHINRIKSSQQSWCMKFIIFKEDLEDFFIYCMFPQHKF